MWPFSKSKKLSEAQEKTFRMINEYNEKEKQIAEIRVFTQPIIDRALKVRLGYLELGNETGDFEVSATEMDYIKREMELLSFAGEPTMLLGMNVVVL